MEFISANKISAELVNYFDEGMNLDLAKRLEDENYKTPINGFKDWHLLSTLTIKRPQLIFDYIHLLDEGPFDEN